MSGLQRVRREDAVAYAFAVAEPQLRVAQGESFVLETRDSPDGRIKKTTDLFDVATLGEVLTHGYNNPCAGPVYVEGAEAGDTLVVEIVDIIPSEIGFVATEGNMGPLLGTKYPELLDHYTEMVEHRPGASGTTSDGTAYLTNGTSWVLEPMIGCMGVVPHRTEQGNDTLTMQTRFGGNLDSTDVKKGHRIYYPVAREGAVADGELRVDRHLDDVGVGTGDRGPGQRRRVVAERQRAAGHRVGATGGQGSRRGNRHRGVVQRSSGASHVAGGR